MNHNEPYSDDYLRDILSSVKTIAMVGASPDKTKFSYGVLRVLNETGYDTHRRSAKACSAVLRHKASSHKRQDHRAVFTAHRASRYGTGSTKAWRCV